MRIRLWWDRIRDSLWFLPGLMTLAAIALAVGMTELDVANFGPDAARENWWLFGGSAQGARAILSTIAGSLITVTGVLFSITIVALQLGSTQFTPRVLQNFMSDRGNQTVMGVFIGTFTYSLMVLRAVRAPMEDGFAAFVPGLAVTVGVILALVSMGFLIYYIDHIAGWLEASTILDRVTDNTLHQLRRRFPDGPHRTDGGQATEGAAMRAGGSIPTNGWAAADRTTMADDWAEPDDEPSVLPARKSGYVQMTDQDRILRAASEHDAIVRVERGIGEFVVAGAPFMSIWPAAALDAALEEELWDSVAVGHRRTITQDPALGVLQLADIAVKALSPSINDPTTATMAIDRLGQVLVEFGDRAPRNRLCRDDLGRVRLIAPAFDFASAVETAFSQIRRFGGANATVLNHLIGTVATIGECAERADRHVLLRLLDDIDQEARQRIAHEADRHRVERALAGARRTLTG